MPLAVGQKVVMIWRTEANCAGSSQRVQAERLRVARNANVLLLTYIDNSCGNYLVDHARTVG